MSDNPEVARGPDLNIKPDNQSCVPINTCEFDAQNGGYMDGVGPISTTLPSESGNMLGDDQNPLLLENFKGNFAQDSATDGDNVTCLQGKNDQIKRVKDEQETTWTDEMEKILNTAVCYVGEDSRSPNLALKNSCPCQDISFELSSKRKREIGEGENSPNRISPVESRWVQLQEEEINIQEQKLKLEKKRLRWLRRWQQLDLELEEKRLDNKLLELQNQCLAFEIQQKTGCECWKQQGEIFSVSAVSHP